MASPRRTIAIAIVGMLIFGSCTFAVGILIGATRAERSAVETPAAAEDPASGGPAMGDPAADGPSPGESDGGDQRASPGASPTQSGQGTDGGDAASAGTPASSAAQPSTPEATSPAGASPAATSPAATPPVKVTDLHIGLPPSMPPVSALRGPLVTAATAPALPPAAPDASAPMPAAAPPAEAGPPPPVVSVQIGLFLHLENAERRAGLLAERGYAPMIVMAEDPGQPVWYAVTLGPIADPAEAEPRARALFLAEGLPTSPVSWRPAP